MITYEYSEENKVYQEDNFTVDDFIPSGKNGNSLLPVESIIIRKQQNMVSKLIDRMVYRNNSGKLEEYTILLEPLDSSKDIIDLHIILKPDQFIVSNVNERFSIYKVCTGSEAQLDFIYNRYDSNIYCIDFINRTVSFTKFKYVDGNWTIDIKVENIKIITDGNFKVYPNRFRLEEIKTENEEFKFEIDKYGITTTTKINSSGDKIKYSNRKVSLIDNNNSEFIIDQINYHPMVMTRKSGIVYFGPGRGFIEHCTVRVSNNEIISVKQEFEEITEVAFLDKIHERENG